MRALSPSSRFRCVSILLLASMCLAPSSLGCAKENNVTTNNNNTYNTTNNISQVLGAQGGFVENVPVGGRLDLPPGALTQDITLKIGELSDPAQLPLPAGMIAVSKIISFEPHGQTFSTDIKLSVSHTAGARQDVTLLRAEPKGAWAPASHTELTSALIQRSTSTLSFYVAVVPAQAVGKGGAGGAGSAGGASGKAGAATAGGSNSGGGAVAPNCESCAEEHCAAERADCIGDVACTECFDLGITPAGCESSPMFQALRACLCNQPCGTDCSTISCSGSGQGGAGGGTPTSSCEACLQKDCATEVGACNDQPACDVCLSGSGPPNACDLAGPVGDAVRDCGCGTCAVQCKELCADGGGGSSGGGGSAGAGGSASGPECTTPSTCPGTDGDCQTRTCVAQKCGFSFTSAGAVLPQQEAGDCKTKICDGSGGISLMNNDSDPPMGGSPCITNECKGGTPSSTPKPPGTDCGSGMKCDAAGECLPG